MLCDIGNHVYLQCQEDAFFVPGYVLQQKYARDGASGARGVGSDTSRFDLLEDWQFYRIHCCVITSPI